MRRTEGQTSKFLVCFFLDEQADKHELHLYITHNVYGKKLVYSCLCVPSHSSTLPLSLTHKYIAVLFFSLRVDFQWLKLIHVKSPSIYLSFQATNYKIGLLLLLPSFIPYILVYILLYGRSLSLPLTVRCIIKSSYIYIIIMPYYTSLQYFYHHHY